MGWYRRSKAFDTFRRFASKIVPKSQIPESISRISQPNSSAPILNKIRISGSSLTPPTSKNLGFQFGSKQNSFSLSLGLRHYYVDRYQVHHFRPRGPRKWFQNPRYLFIVTVVGSAVVITLYYGNLETIPYTKRTHLVLLSPSVEKQICEAQFKQIMAEFKGKILPAIHPDSIRVTLIAKDIIGALQRGLKKEDTWTDLDYASDPHESGGYEALVAPTQSSEGKWHKEDEVLDDKWVQQSRKKGQERRVQSSTAHLEGLNWEILVVNEPVVNAFCLPDGKIVVFTGLLDHFKTNEEIATIIGHEVGHVVARHGAEGITKNLWFAVTQLVLYMFVMPDFVYSMSTLFLKLPFSRRMEIEADYIGLLLLASAGYDPRVAPKVYEKLDKVNGGSALNDYLSTHPSGKKRAKLLAQAKVMEEAQSIYLEARLGRGIEGFL